MHTHAVYMCVDSARHLHASMPTQVAHLHRYWALTCMDIHTAVLATHMHSYTHHTHTDLLDTHMHRYSLNTIPTGILGTFIDVHKHHNHNTYSNLAHQVLHLHIHTPALSRNPESLLLRKFNHRTSRCPSKDTEPTLMKLGNRMTQLVM